MRMRNELRVLVVHNRYKIPGGEDAVVNNELRLLRCAGIEVYEYIRDNKELDECGPFGKTIKLASAVFSLKAYKDITKIVQDNKISIVHVHNTLCLVTPAVYVAAKKHEVPIVQTMHNFRFVCAGATMYRSNHICEDCKYKKTPALKNRCYRSSFVQTAASVFTQKLYSFLGIYKSLNYIFLTDFSRNKIEEFNNGKHKFLNLSKTYVRPNFSFSTNSVLPKSKRKQRIVFAGRIDEQKGIKELLSLWEDSFGFELLICGIGPCSANCEIAAKTKKSVRYVGFVENEELLQIIAESEALVMPTLWYEGMPMVVVESFSVGTPVLGSNIGNVSSMIEPGKNGYVFNPRDKDELRNCLVKIGSNDLTLSTYEIFDGKYSSAKALQSILDIYSRCIDGR